MNDKIIINSISKIYFIVVSLVSFIFLTLSCIFILLQNGIYIEKISVPSIKVEKLYIKWNEKIDISVEKIKIITQIDEKFPSLDETRISQTLSRISLLRHWFEKINIRHITINEIDATFQYTDQKEGLINISSSDFFLQSSFLFGTDFLNISINSFKDLKRKIDAHGNLLINTRTTELTSILYADIHKEAIFKIFIDADTKKVSYALESLQSITQTKHIFEILNLPQEIKLWTQDAITMSSLSLDCLHGWFDYKHIDEAYKHVYLHSTFHDLHYKYDKQLDTITSKSTQLELKNGTLFIHPEEAYTYGFFLDKTWLKIDFTTPDELLTLHLLFKGMLNTELLGVLNRYKIKLPFLQKNGVVDTNLRLVINLQNSDIDAYGDFFVKQGNFDYLGLNIDIFDTSIALQNNDVTIKNMSAKYKDIAVATIDVQLDAKENIGKIEFKIQKAVFKDVFLELDTTHEPLNVTYTMSPTQDILTFAKSKWMFEKYPLNVDMLDVAFDLQTLTAQIPLTSVNIPNIASTLISGEVSLRPNKLDLNVDILKYNHNGIELSQPKAPLKVTYDEKLNIFSKDDIQLLVNNTKIIAHKTSLDLIDKDLHILYSSLDVENYLKTDLSGNYNFKNKTGLFDIQKLEIHEPSIGEIFLKNDPFVLKIKSLDEKTVIKSDDLNIEYLQTDEQWKLQLHSLSKISPYSPILQEYNLTNGNFAAYKKSNTTQTNFFSKIKYPYKVLAKKNFLIENYTIKGNINHESKDIALSINNCIDVNISDSVQITAKKVGINIDAVLDFFHDKNTSSTKTTSATKNTNQNYAFKATDSYLYVGKNRYVLSDTLGLQYDHDILNAQLVHKKGSADFKLENKTFYLYGDNFNDEFMENLFSLSKFKGGTLAFSMQGSTKEYDGIFYIKDTTVIEYKLLNNILAFVNTIPSLVTFSLPSYNRTGLAVKTSYVNFHSTNDIFTLSDIYLDSQEIDILGKGTASFKNDSIDVLLNLKTDLGSSLAQIPVVGYILLDKDSISTSLSLSGKLSDPDVKNLIAQEIIIAPLNILKRTLMLPFHLFSDEEKE